jgi:O-antigen/teichoic acid export membrane protein
VAGTDAQPGDDRSPSEGVPGRLQGDDESGTTIAGPDPDTLALSPPGLAASGVWNLALSVLSKSQSLAIPVAGAVVGGLSGIGIATAAMGSCWLGAALADFGLVGELGRLSVSYPTKPTISRCLRALTLQAPLALLLAPTVFYLSLGHRTDASVGLLVAIGLLGSFLAGSTGLTAMLNGLGDFRTPAVWLGSMRFVSGFVAIGLTVAAPSAVSIIGSFAAGEGLGMVALAISLRRARRALPDRDEPDAVVKRTHAWLGAAAVTNILTNQSDTILVAPILSGDELGLFAIASLFGNGVATLALAPSTPYSFRVVAATVAGEREEATARRRSAFAVAGIVAALFAALSWGVTQIAGSSIGELSAVATGDGPIVLGLYLAAMIPFVLGAVCFAIGIGYARHRAVGTAQILTGVIGVASITTGAYFAGAVGAAAATVLRDSTLLILASRVITSPPYPARAAPQDSDQ